WSAEVAGVNVSDAALYLNAPHPHPPLSAKRLLSFTMKSTSCKLPGTVALGNVSICLGFQWTFAILAPSGNGLPLPGMPDWYALIITGLARIAAITLSLWLMETVCQLSYPLNSENASPFGTRTLYLAPPVSCAVAALTPTTASPETASNTTMLTTTRMLL